MVFEICERTDRQRNEHTYTVITIVRIISGCKLNMFISSSVQSRRVNGTLVSGCGYIKVQTRWLYCVECPQYSLRLEALGYLCRSCLLLAFDDA